MTSDLRKIKSAFLPIDFAFAIITFFIVFFLIYGYFHSYLVNTENGITLENLQGDARDICFLLISTPGSPSNWENNLSGLNFAGLKNVSGDFLDSKKILAMNKTDYFNIIDHFAASGYINVNIEGLKSGTNYLNFGVMNENNMFSQYTCYSNYNLEPVKVVVGIWK